MAVGGSRVVMDVKRTIKGGVNYSGEGVTYINRINQYTRMGSYISANITQPCWDEPSWQRRVEEFVLIRHERYSEDAADKHLRTNCTN